jgi:hypothetical protein
VTRRKKKMKTLAAVQSICVSILNIRECERLAQFSSSRGWDR